MDQIKPVLVCKFLSKIVYFQGVVYGNAGCRWWSEVNAVDRDQKELGVNT